MERSTTGSILRTTQAWCGQLCEKQTLSHGIAYYSRHFPELPEANQFREIVIEDPSSLPKAVAESNEWFESQNLTCHRWAPAVGQASDQLSALLETNGFRKRIHTAMVLTRWVELQPVPDIRVVHARAMRAALRETFLESDSPTSAAESGRLADACEERMNDPQFDMFVALVNGRPAGRCALYQVGDIARVMDLSVRSAFDDSEVDRALVAHMLSLAKRLSMRNICVQVADSNSRGCAWFEPFGFVADGTIEEFDRDASHRPDGPPC